MNTALRWIIATVGWLALLVVYAVWKDVEKHTGGGFITGFLRGAIVFGGAYYLYKWAKNESRQTKQEISPQSKTAANNAKPNNQKPSSAQLEQEATYANDAAMVQKYQETLNWLQSSVERQVEALSETVSLAERGDAVAQYNLGVMYVEGVGVKQDILEALKWLRLSAAQGHSTAQFALDSCQLMLAH